MPYDVLVIGGGPAGLSAAVNVRIRGRSVLVVSNPRRKTPLAGQNGWTTTWVCRVTAVRSF